MTVDTNFAPPSSNIHDEEKLPLYIDEDYQQQENYPTKKHRNLHWKSYLYPILLALLIVLATVVLVVVLTRSSSSRLNQEEHKKFLLDHHKIQSIPCTPHGDVCLCPVSFVHSPSNPVDCLPTGSRCLPSCLKNSQCACHQLKDAVRCQQVTRHWIENELHFGPVQPLRSMFSKQSSLESLERFLITHEKSNKHIFFSKDRHTAITLDGKQDEYLLNENWTKLDTNTTEQHLVYSQVDVQTHSCLLSSIWSDGSILHGRLHTCPGLHASAPYFFASACDDVLVLWHGANQLNHIDKEDWTSVRHHFESNLPRLTVLLDPFHRYYSLYDDSMIEIKDLNANVLAQFFTDIQRATKFQFLDHQGTLLVANQTHMQLFTTLNQLNWLDV